MQEIVGQQCIDQRGVFDETAIEEAVYQGDALIHECFEKQVAQAPESIAVTCGGNSLTYRELNEKANQLAHYLRRKGVAPERLVGICLERSLDAVLSIMAVLKAGGAYVALDPADPPDRLAYVLNTIGAGVLITQESLQNRIQTRPNALILLEQCRDDIGRCPVNNPVVQEVQLRSDHLAYVTFTSGSTGRPKGVMTEHRNAMGFFAAAQKVFRFTEREIWSVFHSFSYDFSVWEIFGALLHGGRLVVVPYLTARSPREFYSLLCRERVTVLSQTPSAFVRLFDAEAREHEQRHSLRWVIFAGELLRSSSLQSWVKRNPLNMTRLVNMYGTTETTVHATSHVVTPAELQSDGGCSVGKALPGYRIHILNEIGDPAPCGERGEIYIGGPGVSRGYLNSAELSAERFVTDNLSSDPVAKLYRTGDIGKLHIDGTLEYFGRNDHQVKIRGHRVELSEIERQLTWHENVKEAVIIARDDESGEKQLVAYVSPNIHGMKSEGSPERLREEIVGGWDTIFSKTYETENPAGGPTFAGWHWASNYRAAPITEPEMQEWLACTIQRIRALRPKKVLEIGCGVGLIVEAIAAECETYVGTDISKAGLAQLTTWLQGRSQFKHVELLHREATQLQEFPGGAFDTVVLNTVVQYFPDIDYLLAVLNEAVRVLSPGGNIFLGDIRNYALLPVLHSALQLRNANPALSAKHLRMRVTQAVAQEKELAIDPHFFSALPERIPGVGSVRIQMKTGRAQNDLTRYRYDVVVGVTKSGSMCIVPSYEEIDWHDIRSMARFDELLRPRRPSALSLVSIPNSRLIDEVALWRDLAGNDDSATVKELMHRQPTALQANAEDPGTLWDLANKHNYEVSACWHMESPELFAMHLVDRTQSESAAGFTVPVGHRADAGSPYCTNPLQESVREHLIPRLRNYLKEQLPAHMIPSAWVIMTALPLTLTGKVDRSALPKPGPEMPNGGEYSRPQGYVEETLAEIWEEVLQVRMVGRTANFFELGGHSFAILKLAAKVTRVFGVTLEFLTVFTNSSFLHMARQIETLMSNRTLSANESAASFDEFRI